MMFGRQRRTHRLGPTILSVTRDFLFSRSEAGEQGRIQRLMQVGRGVQQGLQTTPPPPRYGPGGQGQSTHRKAKTFLYCIGSTG